MICMRKAGVSVESLIEYVKMCMQVDTTFSARLHLLQEEKEKLEEQRSQLETAMKRLDYKISRYQKAVDTGELNWYKDTCNND